MRKGSSATAAPVMRSRFGIALQYEPVRGGRARRGVVQIGRGRPKTGRHGPLHRARPRYGQTAIPQLRNACGSTSPVTHGNAPRVAARRCWCPPLGGSRSPTAPRHAASPVGGLDTPSRSPRSRGRSARPVAHLIERFGAHEQHRSDHEPWAALKPCESHRLYPGVAGRWQHPFNACAVSGVIGLAGPTVARSGRDRMATWSSATCSGSIRASGFNSRTSAPGISRSANARLTPPANPGSPRSRCSARRVRCRTGRSPGGRSCRRPSPA